MLSNEEKNTLKNIGLQFFAEGGAVDLLAPVLDVYNKAVHRIAADFQQFLRDVQARFDIQLPLRAKFAEFRQEGRVQQRLTTTEGHTSVRGSSPLFSIISKVAV